MEDELFALKAIFEDDFMYERCADESVRGTLIASITLPDPIHLQLPSTESVSDTPESASPSKSAATSQGSVEPMLLPVSHLPPITIRFRLPPSYPSAPPKISLECPWISAGRTKRLEEKCMEMWREEGNGDVMMYRILDFIKEDGSQWLNLVGTDQEGKSILKLTSDDPSSDDVTRHEKLAPSKVSKPSTEAAVKPPRSDKSPCKECADNKPTATPNTPPASTSSTPPRKPTSSLYPSERSWQSPENLRDVIDIIMDHDRKTSQYIFDRGLVTCGICFDEMRGKNCLRFSGCKHSYCRDCLGDYFTLMIREGEIKQVSCPDESCKKKHHASTPAANNSTATGSSNPTPTLNDDEILAIVGPELFTRYKELKIKQALEGRVDVTYCPRPSCGTHVIKEAGEEKLCICGTCRFAFCFFCGRTWHGYAQYCKISRLMEVALEYEQASEEKKQILEIRYGKKVLEKAVRDMNDERLNKEWMAKNSQKCPNCMVPVQRSMGCSHMTLCGCTLHASNPYQHFNERKSTCYGRLFEDNDGNMPDGNEMMMPEEDEEDELDGGAEQQVNWNAPRAQVFGWEEMDELLNL
ncbi:E3 ubiquitin-protein ligase rnf14 [Phlyctochytrium planicorne]|nr:E3 ubiquitin-protein ligase rnf14 [Phlyctochytrium planicorne]